MDGSWGAGEGVRADGEHEGGSWGDGIILYPGRGCGYMNLYICTTVHPKKSVSLHDH